MAPADVRTMLSFDELVTAENASDLEPLHGEVIDMLGHRPGVPPHELRLFVGALPFPLPMCRRVTKWLVVCMALCL